MRRFVRRAALLLLFLPLLSCDPPNFAWPETIPDVKIPEGDGPAAFDRWKEARLAETNPVLVAGAAKVDLTPKDWRKIFIAGYSPNKRAAGIGGEISGRVMLFDDGVNTLVLVSTDFVGYPNERVWDVRRRVSKKYGKSILISATHNHASPDTVGMWGAWAFYALPVATGADPHYMRMVERRLAEAIVRAAYSARPARLYAGKVEIPAGISENAHKAGWKDDEMTVLQARGLAGETIATAVNYACHAEFLGNNNDRIHPDFPGFLYPELERREGGMALFMNGALGGIIVPAMPRRTENHVRLREKAARRAGSVLAAYASQAMRDAQPLSFKEIRIRRSLLSLPVENAFFRLLGEKKILDRVMTDEGLYSEVWRVDMGGFQMVSVPGEIFPSLGFEIKKIMPGPYRMIVGLGNDELGYIMTAAEWEESLYDYEKTVSLGPETGPRLMQAVRSLFAEPGTGTP